MPGEFLNDSNDTDKARQNLDFLPRTFRVAHRSGVLSHSSVLSQDVSAPLYEYSALTRRASVAPDIPRRWAKKHRSRNWFFAFSS